MRRPRRLRKNKIIRESLVDINLQLQQLVSGLFVVEGENVKREIPSMPGIYQMSVDVVLKEVSEYIDYGIDKYILFGLPNSKSFEGKEAADKKGPVPTALKALKDQFSDEVLLYADVCLCEYTDHGHCGIPDDRGYIQNDLSLNYLGNAALTYAEAGADFVAPSNMMDFRVQSIREVLDAEDYHGTSILSYSAKFSSAYYGPFRDAANSAPSYGDRSTYQLDYRGYKQAMYELESDELQGADALMVKPALAYLDILKRARAQTNLPLYVYNVSGEYSMVKLAAKHGLLDERKIVLENLYAMRRAGADMIITYHAVEAARNEWIRR